MENKDNHQSSSSQRLMKQQKHIRYQIQYCKKKIKREVLPKAKKQVLQNRRLIQKLVELEWMKVGLEKDQEKAQKKMRRIQLEAQELRKYTKQTDEIERKNQQLREQISKNKDKNEEKKRMIRQDQKYLTNLKKRNKIIQEKVRNMKQIFQETTEKNKIILDKQDKILQYELKGTKVKDVVYQKVCQIEELNNKKQIKEEMLQKLKQSIIITRKKLEIEQKKHTISECHQIKHSSNSKSLSLLEQKNLAEQKQDEMSNKLIELQYQIKRQEGKLEQEILISSQLKNKKDIVLERLNKLKETKICFERTLSEMKQGKQIYHREKIRIKEEFNKGKLWALLEIQHASNFLRRQQENEKKRIKELMI